MCASYKYKGACKEMYNNIKRKVQILLIYWSRNAYIYGLV